MNKATGKIASIPDRLIGIIGHYATSRVTLELMVIAPALAYDTNVWVNKIMVETSGMNDLANSEYPYQYYLCRNQTMYGKIVNLVTRAPLNITSDSIIFFAESNGFLVTQTVNYNVIFTNLMTPEYPISFESRRRIISVAVLKIEGGRQLYMIDERGDLLTTVVSRNNMSGLLNSAFSSILTGKLGFYDLGLKTDVVLKGAHFTSINGKKDEVILLSRTGKYYQHVRGSQSVKFTGKKPMLERPVPRTARALSRMTITFPESNDSLVVDYETLGKRIIYGHSTDKSTEGEWTLFAMCTDRTVTRIIARNNPPTIIRTDHNWICSVDRVFSWPHLAICDYAIDT